MFDDIRLYFAFRKARGAIERLLAMQDGKTILLNGLKHFLMSIGAIALAAILGYLANDQYLYNLLEKSGIPGFIAIALVPLLHSLIAMAQKKWFPPEASDVHKESPSANIAGTTINQ